MLDFAGDTRASLVNQMISGGTVRVLNILWFVVVYSVAIVDNVYSAGNEDLFTNCGGVLEARKGVIQSPNFPRPFPYPISCEWLIHAPAEKKIVIYLTQFYLKDNFYVTEYDYYHQDGTHAGRHDLGRISWEFELSTIAAYKPYVLIRFSTNYISNLHLRVLDFLLDVHGFNITYEIMDRTADVNKETCSTHQCSYLGNCIANANFSEYKCNCFDGYFGDTCQYGPYCDPDNGINQCWNGGRCRYFIGSLINQCNCPYGFYGSYCEISAGLGDDHECNNLQCSQKCERDMTGRPFCLCKDGYKLNSDNKTCMPIARYRINVEAVLVPRTNSSVMFLQADELDFIKQNVLVALEDNGVATISKFRISGIRNTSKGYVLKFYFYCKVSDLNNIERALQAVVGLGNMKGLEMVNSAPKYDTSPELQLVKISSYDQQPALKGKLLTLVCAAKGSKRLKFRWYKDTFPIDIHLSKRNAWETRIPNTEQDVQLSVLNIDDITPYDKGTFTCEVMDFDDDIPQYDSITVDVINYPLVEVEPMSDSVKLGDEVNIKCLSPDSSGRPLVYEWYKNGWKIESDSKMEYSEHLFPAGVQLVIPNPQRDAEYTCKVINDAGPANVSSHIFVVKGNATDLYCEKETVGLVPWKRTAGGHFDVQRCPMDSGDFSLSGAVDSGFATRNCKCDVETDTCAWSEPNFAKCQSLILVNIYDDVERLRLGYQHSTLANVFRSLYEFILTKNRLLYSGDIEVAAGILKKILQHGKNFPEEVLKTELISAEHLTELMNAMLEKTLSATVEEKQILTVGPNLIRMTEILFTGAFRCLKFSSKLPIQYSKIAMDIRPLPTVQPDKSNEAHMSKRSVVPQGLQLESKNGSTQVIRMTLPGLPSLMIPRISAEARDKGLQDPTEFASHMISLAPYSMDNTSHTRRVQVTIDHIGKFGIGKLNRTICQSWKFTDSNTLSNMYNGEWTDDSCTLVTYTEDYTTCECNIPVHIVVAVYPQNETVIDVKPLSDVDVALFASYCVNLAILLITIFVFLITWKNLVGELYLVHLNLVISLLASTIISIVCLVSLSKPEVLMAAGNILVHFFHLAAMSFLVMELAHIFIVTYNLGKLIQTGIRYSGIGWVMAVVMTIALVVASEVLEYNVLCNKLCWSSMEHWQFYAFLAPVALLIAAYLAFMILCLWTIYRWTDEHKYADRRKYMVNIGKSAHIQFMLLVASLLAVGVHQSRVQVGFHIVFMVGTSLAILIHRCFLDKQIRSVLWTMCIDMKNKKLKLRAIQSSSSFRAFIRPEKLANANKNQEEYNVSKYYEEVDRAKYTREKKRQLSELLGSSASASAAAKPQSGTRSVEGSKESEVTDIDAMIPIEKGGRDSGMFEFGDGDRTNGTANDSPVWKPRCTLSIRYVTAPNGDISDNSDSAFHSSGSNDGCVVQIIRSDYNTFKEMKQPVCVKSPIRDTEIDSKQPYSAKSVIRGTEIDSKTIGPAEMSKDSKLISHRNPHHFTKTATPNGGRNVSRKGREESPLSSKSNTSCLPVSGEVDYDNECSVLLHTPTHKAKDTLSDDENECSVKLLHTTADSPSVFNAL